MTTRARSGTLCAIALGVLSGAACAGPATAPARVGGAPSPMVATASVVAEAPSRSAEVPADAAWQRARGEDALERARLAEAEGAAGLWDVALGGGEAEAVALAALPWADDAEMVLAELVRRAAGGDAAGRRARLEAALGVAARPATSRDALDPDGLRAAAAALVALASRADLPDDERALAVSAARALAERGALDPARVPTDLDPK